MSDLVKSIKDSIYIGQYIDLPLGEPNGSNFITSGSTLLRSEYPELNTLYPQNPPVGLSITETLRSFPVVSDTNILGGCYGNGALVLLEYNINTLLYSTDLGLTWNTTVLTGEPAYQIRFVAGVFYLVAVDGLYMMTDISTASSITKIFNTTSENSIQHFYVINNTILISRYAITTIDVSYNLGASWDSLTIGTSTNTTGFHIGHAGNKFIVVKSISTSTTEAWSADENDLTVWISFPTTTSQMWNTSTQDENAFMIVGAFGIVQYTVDGSSWNYRTSMGGLSFGTGFLFKNYYFVTMINQPTSLFYTINEYSNSFQSIYLTDANYKNHLFSDGANRFFSVPNSTTYTNSISIFEFIPEDPNIVIPADDNKYVRVK